MSQKMPVLFVGHGSPMNAIEDNSYSREWKKIADQIPVPRGIVCISAHWLREGTAVTAMQNPKTIHDFYGFPRDLYSINYPAPGSLELATQIQKLVKTTKVNLDQEWGLDHGSWSVLKHIYPEANIPVVQLSLDYNLSLQKMVQLGKELSILRENGILILGSGNLVHNLMKMNMKGEPFSWATEFEAYVKKAIEKKDAIALENYSTQGSSILAHPTNEHYLPLLYCIGAAGSYSPSFFNEEIVMGSVSMLGVLFNSPD